MAATDGSWARFAFFGGYHDGSDAKKGWRACLGTGVTAKEAIGDALIKSSAFQWWHVVDLLTGTIVESSDNVTERF